MNQFIDKRNIYLWELLSKAYEIKIKDSINGEYSCFVQERNATIYVDFQNISIDSFTHELLHIYTKFKEFYIGASIKMFIKGDDFFQIIISDDLLEHIGNCLDHIKIFPIYQKLGFDEHEFLYDFEDYKCNNEELLTLTRNYRIHNFININAIDFYIGKLMAMLCDPNVKNDYSKPLSEFKKLDNRLFEIIEDLITDTKKFDIEDSQNSYIDITYDFYTKLNNWREESNFL